VARAAKFVVTKIVDEYEYYVGPGAASGGRREGAPQ
jgi:hypothetical protein